MFSMLWHPKTLQNLAMYNVFFIFGRFSIAGKLPKWSKIPFQYPLALRHPKILEKCRKHHRILVSARNRFWGLVSVRNRFCPPPAKADIATAILTNVIEHLVLLLPPNKHAFTAKAVWADFMKFYMCSRNPLVSLCNQIALVAVWYEFWYGLTLAKRASEFSGRCCYAGDEGSWPRSCTHPCDQIAPRFFKRTLSLHDLVITGPCVAWRSCRCCVFEVLVRALLGCS